MTDATDATAEAFPGGVWPVMLTPFAADLSIDWSAYDELIDWYLDSGVAGLFSVCLSSELFHLNFSERLQLAERAVRHAAGRAPVVAAGAMGDSFEEMAEQTHRLAETGVQAVVCLTNQFAGKEENEAAWKRGAEQYLACVDSSIPLGLYECPRPYHRILSPELLLWAAETGRFYFHKDTCCDLQQIRRKIDRIASTRLRFFNANSETLLESLQLGGSGFSGIGANFYPQLYVWMCERHASEGEMAGELQKFMNESGARMLQGYPAAAKLFLSLCGLRLGKACRVDQTPPAADEQNSLLRFRERIQEWHRRLNLKETKTFHRL